MKALPRCDMDFLMHHTRLMLSSYRRWTGKSLWPGNKPNDVLAREVFFAPFVLCSTGTEKDPVLNYGNQKALDLWEMDWSTFVQTPGRLTAEPSGQNERERFLETVKRQGYVNHYHGVRISAKGRRFEIQEATVWNLTDEDGCFAGQAASFSKWKPVQ